MGTTVPDGTEAKTLEQDNPEFLSELLAVLVKRAGGEVMLSKEDVIGPYELRFLHYIDDATGEQYLKLVVTEHHGAMN